MATKKQTAGAAPPKKTALRTAMDAATPKKTRIVMDDVMLDLETLDTAVTAAILSIGACRFNETEIDGEGFYRAITIQSNIDEHRTISGNTLAWWVGQGEKAKRVFADPAAVPLGQALDELRAWLGTPVEAKNKRVYGNGSNFDISILDHAYAAGGQTSPWEFYNVRCFRTLKSLPSARNVPKPENVLAHNALFDAIAQAQHLQALWAAGVGK